MENYGIEERNWPTRNDYDQALDKFDDHMLDEELKQGKLLRQAKTNTLVHRGRPDGFTCSYLIDDWIIRCFCYSEENEQDPDDSLPARYRQLELFYQQNHSRVSALIPLTYVEKGISVDFYHYNILGHIEHWLKKRVVPFVKMPLIKGHALNDFIALSYKKKQKMLQLSEAWMRMINEMEAVQMAHGDLDLTNVLVTENPDDDTLVLKLIDYDNTWIPAFEPCNYPLLEYGHENFQHPAFLAEPDKQVFDATLDRFTSLVIYISLQTLVEYPELYEKWNVNDNCLLLRPEDYVAEQRAEPGRISQLKHMNVKDLSLYLDELSACLRQSTLPRSLSAIANESHQLLSAYNKAEQEEQEDPWELMQEIPIADWNSVVYFDPPEQEPPPQQPQANYRPLPGIDMHATEPMAEPEPEPPAPLYQRLSERNQPGASPRPKPSEPPSASPGEPDAPFASDSIFFAPTVKLAPPAARRLPGAEPGSRAPQQTPMPEQSAETPGEILSAEQARPKPAHLLSSAEQARPQSENPPEAVLFAEQARSRDALFTTQARPRSENPPDTGQELARRSEALPAEPTSFASSSSDDLAREEPSTEQIRLQRTTTNPATWLGCSILFLLVILVALAIFLVVSLAHPLHAGVSHINARPAFSGGYYAGNA